MSLSNNPSKRTIIRKSKKIKADEIYQKMEHKKHIYSKPDTYVGSCEPEETTTFIFSNETNKIIKNTLSFSPAWYKCFDELIVNAHDHKKRMDKCIRENTKIKHKKVSCIKISISDDGSISFFNNGDGIHIEYLKKYKMYPVELIFGSLLSSTNFDDSQEREWGGRNGYGAKLANIFSTRFIIETVDHFNRKKLTQEFSNNMNIRNDPVITSVDKSIKPYTKIIWYPDYSKFGMPGMTNDLKAIIKKRVYDVAGITDKNTKIYFNEELIKVKDFSSYINLYIDNTSTTKAEINGLGWDVVALSSDDDVFQHVSFVNGIYTSRGGTHVDYIADQIKIKLGEYFKKKKRINIKPQIIKNQLKLFVNAYKIANPIFDSQTKETLKTTKQKFSTKFEITDEFIKDLVETDIVDKILNQTAFKDSQLLTKTDGKKSKKVKVPKLLDASKAGTKESKKCTLILTEGDSAKTMAVAGLSEVGRDYYGVFPLRGKIQNIRGLSNQRVLNCQILNTVKTIIGLKSNQNYKKIYADTGKWPLRYGAVMLMTDQDHDGSHIKGLVMNIFDCLWPDLLDMGFISSMITPIVKITKGKNIHSFYTLQDYESWKTQNNIRGWKVKYYKGLGTSTTKEAKEYFKQLNIVHYTTTPDIANRLDLAFNSDRAHDRKTWLSNYNSNLIPDFTQDSISFNNFVDEELIHFSNADNIRSLPNIIDGLKPSIRKVVFCSFKRKLTSEIKVAQLSGYTSEHSAYHHGEVSLENTIKNMAQDFVGSNNINFLEPIGQFGSRLQGGKDAAQSRYIFTKLNPITRTLFNEHDDVLCNYLDDDGQAIEPEYYYPILPSLLINGSQGIGTGYSTKIPMYNPLDLSRYIRRRLSGDDSPILIKPWYKGFKGKIESTSEKTYITRGKYEVTKNNTVIINELPIGTWTESYIETLEKLCIERGKEGPKNFIRDIKDDSTEDTVKITIKMNPFTLESWKNSIGKDGITVLENKLKLTTRLSTSNIYAFNKDLQITKYSIQSLLDEWYNIRLGIYTERRSYLLNKIKKELDILSYKAKFITEIVEGTRIINKKKKVVIEQELKDSLYPKINKNFDYLLKMDLYKLTYEEIEILKNKKDLKQTEYNTLIALSDSELWINDLDIFEKKWKHDLVKYNKVHSVPKVIKKKRSKKK